MKIRTAILFMLIGVGAAAGLGLVLFLKSGIYDLAANTPHLELERKLIITLKKNAINFYSMDMEVPRYSSERIQRGAKLYIKNCEACHGGPGIARHALGIGLNPNPPPLVNVSRSWTRKEVVWIIGHGLKMAGMPGFFDTHSREQVYSMAAFVERLSTLAPKEYRYMREWALGKNDGAGANWIAPEQGWIALKEKGDRKKGEKAFGKYGCQSCHVIPGIPGAIANTGPSLSAWSERQYIAGQVVNNPLNLVSWLMKPEEVDPSTLMPNTGVSEKDAWDMASYLFDLE